MNLTMADPPNFNKVINTYFALKTKEGEPFTIPGLALACGFSKSGDILSVLKEYEDGESPYTEPAITSLTRAVTRVEEHCLVNGLKGKFPPALAKFCLGAYHNIKDTNEVRDPNVTQLAIVFSGEGDQPKLIKPVEASSLSITNKPLSLPSMQNVFDSEIDNLIAAL